MPVANSELCAGSSSKLSPALRRLLESRHRSAFDWQLGGLRFPVKFLDRDGLEYALVRAAAGDAVEANMARVTLDQARRLIDCRSGAIAAYSTGGDWLNPGNETNMAAQSGCLRIFALAYALWRRPRDKWCAAELFRGLTGLYRSACGDFHAGPTARPLPFANACRTPEARDPLPRENGWAIEALASYCEYCNDRSALHYALIATRRVLHLKRRTDGRFVRSGQESVRFLADTLAMARAFLQLYRVCLERHWLDLAMASLSYINETFRKPQAGYATSAGISGKARPQIDENISLTRFANLVGQYSGAEIHRQIARHGMKYLALPEVATGRMDEAGILLADLELQSQPLRFPLNRRLASRDSGYVAALRSFGWYKLIQLVAADACPAPLPAGSRQAENNVASHVALEHLGKYDEQANRSQKRHRRQVSDGELENQKVYE